MRNMGRKLAALLLAVALIGGLTLIPTEAADIPDGYTPIYTPQDLYDIRQNSGRNFILMNDIDLSEWGTWTPFTLFGIFDGAGYEIINMNTTDGGLFTTVNNGTIKNVRLNGGTINVKTSVYSSGYGSLANQTVGDVHISNCSSSVKIVVSSLEQGHSIGGLVGQATNAIEIVDCHYFGAITGLFNSGGYNYVGGIIGNAGGTPKFESCCNSGDIDITSSSPVYGGGLLGCASASSAAASQGTAALALEITNSNNVGDIHVKSNNSVVGGIAGHISSPSSWHWIEISKCYNMGAVSTSWISGGIAGVFGGYENGSVLSDCYNLGNVTADNASGIVNGNSYGNTQRCYNAGTINDSIAITSSGSASNCYYLNSSAISGGVSSVVALTESQMRHQSSFAGFDFDSVWHFEDGKRYPQLKTNPHNHTGGSFGNLTEATCTSAGVYGQRCKYCSEILSTEPIPAYGHAPETIVDLAATCTTNGASHDECTICNANLGNIKVIPATGHTPGEWRTMLSPKCVDEGRRDKRCTICGETLESEPIPATGHSFGAWAVVREESPPNLGEKQSTCSNCGTKETLYTMSIPKGQTKGLAYLNSSLSIIVSEWQSSDTNIVSTVRSSAKQQEIQRQTETYNAAYAAEYNASVYLTNTLMSHMVTDLGGGQHPDETHPAVIAARSVYDTAKKKLQDERATLIKLTNYIDLQANQAGTAIISVKSSNETLTYAEITVTEGTGGSTGTGDEDKDDGGDNNPEPNRIFRTKYEATPWNWIKFFLLFGWVWMWF